MKGGIEKMKNIENILTETFRDNIVDVQVIERPYAMNSNRPISIYGVLDKSDSEYLVLSRYFTCIDSYEMVYDKDQVPKPEANFHKIAIPHTNVKSIGVWNGDM
ncbi:MAG: hypothetical protein ACI83O_000521 [Patescibacteria group bacterium]